MSKQSLKKVLERIEEDIKRTSNAYRNLISNYEIHEFTIKAEDIIDEVEKEMKAREGVKKLSLKTSRIVRKEVRKMCKTLYLEFHPKRFDKSGKKWTKTSELKGSPTSFSFVLASKPGKTSNVFNVFKRIKQKAQKPLIKALNKKLRELNRGRKEGSQAELIKSQKGFLDIGHESDSSVSLQRAAKVQKALWKFDGNKSLSPLARQVIDELSSQITWEISKDDKGPPTDIIRAKLESKRINRASTSEEKKEVLNLNKALKKAIEAIGTEFAYIEGSDSSVTKRQKIVVGAFVEPLRGKKGIKVTAKSTKVKRSKGKAVLAIKKAKAQQKKYVDKDRTKLDTEVSKRKGASSAPLALISLLNRRLPETVAKNMKAPGLVNRTGRFAGSVKATDVIKTPKGFPSIGYTYEKNPYEVFEVGSSGNWATPERDPRAVIDRSIREIAAELAIGRFYTRRQ